jgi:small subunit ribosomal protein S6
LNTVTEKKLYEGMFLVDSALASSDWDGIVESIRNILEREGAEIETLKKWDDRTLAYPIEGKNRGTYILCYFRLEGPKMEQVERNIQLSEQILRSLILSTEKMAQEDIVKPTPIEAAEQRVQEAAEKAQQQREEAEPEKEEVAEQASPAGEDMESTEGEPAGEVDSSEDSKEDKSEE